MALRPGATVPGVRVVSIESFPDDGSSWTLKTGTTDLIVIETP